jgi:hypothetical protein
LAAVTPAPQFAVVPPDACVPSAPAAADEEVWVPLAKLFPEAVPKGAVFPADATLEAADALCDATPTSDVPIAVTTDKIARVLIILFMCPLLRE